MESRKPTRLQLIPRAEQSPTQELPIHPSNFYSRLLDNLRNIGFPRAKSTSGQSMDFIDNLRTIIHINYPYAQKEGSMFLSVDNPQREYMIWKVKFRGTKLEESTIPRNPTLLEIAYWTMLGPNLPVYTPTMDRSPIHPAVQGLDKTTIDYFNVLQKLHRESIRRNL